jgi:hypothetical protein
VLEAMKGNRAAGELGARRRSGKEKCLGGSPRRAEVMVGSPIWAHREVHDGAGDDVGTAEPGR